MAQEKSFLPAWTVMAQRPEGLKKDSIPLSAQIVSLVGAYCSLTEERLYRRAFNGSQAFEILEAEKDIKFNPELLDICRKISTQFI